MPTSTMTATWMCWSPPTTALRICSETRAKIPPMPSGSKPWERGQTATALEHGSGALRRRGELADRPLGLQLLLAERTAADLWTRQGRFGRGSTHRLAQRPRGCSQKPESQRDLHRPGRRKNPFDPPLQALVVVLQKKV